MASRNYVADLPGGTATTTIQMQNSGTIKNLSLSYLSAAAGKIELSTSGTSQIGTAQPTGDVLYRWNCSGTAGNVVTVLDTPSISVKAFQSIYIHQTGAGNLGSISFRV